MRASCIGSWLPSMTLPIIEIFSPSPVMRLLTGLLQVLSDSDLVSPKVKKGPTVCEGVRRSGTFIRMLTLFRVRHVFSSRQNDVEIIP